MIVNCVKNTEVLAGGRAGGRAANRRAAAPRQKMGVQIAAGRRGVEWRPLLPGGARLPRARTVCGGEPGGIAKAPHDCFGVHDARPPTGKFRV